MYLPGAKYIKINLSNAKNKFHTNKKIPKYLQRKNYIPKDLKEYGEGGAFPEINVKQYPLNMGKKIIKNYKKL
jgi:hypothetical protein